MPIMVAIKMISKCQAFIEIASDIGKYQAINDKLIVNNRIRLFFWRVALFNMICMS
jgi:hypothetical protein